MTACRLSCSKSTVCPLFVMNCALEQYFFRFRDIEFSSPNLTWQILTPSAA